MPGARPSYPHSYGCTGISPANATWLFNQSKVGDVVTDVGSPRGLESYNGYPMWNMSAPGVG